MLSSLKNRVDLIWRQGQLGDRFLLHLIWKNLEETAFEDFVQRYFICQLNKIPF